MKAMLSQPMAGKTDEEIVATREKAIEVLKEKGYEIVNTLFTDEWYSSKAMEERGVVQIPLRFLAKSLENMSLCHAAYFCKGWENARGCRIEHTCANEYGIQIIRNMTLEPFKERRVALTKYELADIKTHLIRAEEHYKKQLYFWEQLALRKDSKGELEYPNVVENIKFLRGLKWDVERLLKKIKKME